MNIEEVITAEKAKLETGKANLRHRIEEHYKRKTASFQAERRQFVEADVARTLDNLDQNVTIAFELYEKALNDIEARHKTVIEQNPAIASNAEEVRLQELDICQRSYAASIAALNRSYELLLDI